MENYHDSDEEKESSNSTTGKSTTRLHVAEILLKKDTSVNSERPATIWRRPEAPTERPLEKPQLAADKIANVLHTSQPPELPYATESSLVRPPEIPKPTSAETTAEIVRPTSSAEAAPSQLSEAQEASVAAEMESLDSELELLSELSSDESRAIAEQFTTERRAKLNDEVANLPEDSPEQVAAIADTAFLHRLSEKLGDQTAQELSVEQAVLDAAAEVIDLADLSDVAEAEPLMAPKETDLPIHELSAAERGGEAVSDPNQSSTLSTTNTATTAPLHPVAGTIPRQASGINPNIIPMAGSGGMGNGVNPPFRTGGNGGGGGNVPPSPGFNPNIPSGGGSNPNIGRAMAPNLAATAANVLAAANAANYARRAGMNGLLVGGAVGYLVGRRGGRIKAERHLGPIQQKLERNVMKLQGTIAGQESRIRSLAAEKARQAQAESINQTARPVAVVERDRAETAPLAASTALAAEKIQPTPVPEHTSAEQPAAQSAESTVLRMNKDELLKASETVLVEGISLRQIYEQQNLDERGLRRVMTEHLRGGDVKKALNQELTHQEMRYERDPNFRDLPTPTSNAENAADSTTDNDRASVGHLALASLAGAAKSAKTKVTDVGGQASKQVDKLRSRRNPAEETFMRTWMILIIVLAFIAFILLIR